MNKKNCVLLALMPILIVCCFSHSSFAIGNNVLVENLNGNFDSKPASNLQAGRVSNNSNGEIYVFTTSRSGTEANRELMPGQSVDIPADTAEVKAELVDDSFGDEIIDVYVLMPDGSSHNLSALPATVRIHPADE
ncbi:MAG TPA: hypothetical protein PLO78_09895 [Candidatus Omnitrophota bacterium]|nr:hypothetical protein [Candidatus Omnitrophota bacterium]